MAHVESEARIECGCGLIFQALGDDGHWNEEQTAAAYVLHLEECNFVPPGDEGMMAAAKPKRTTKKAAKP